MSLPSKPQSRAGMPPRKARAGDDPSTFWTRVQTGEGCWLWQGSKQSGGYGNLYWDGCYRLAHRVAYALTHGGSPEVVMHTCDTPACCRPDHLRGGTTLDNMRDMIAKGRGGNAGETNGQAKLTAEAASEIRTRVDLTVKELAERFGVSPRTVRDVRNGCSWRVPA